MSNNIRLSQLNPDLQGKLSKFDTLNDGALSIEEAVQGLVTLQKQSNNYKRMLYLQIPIMILLLACMLGVNILAINITKELKTNDTSGSNLLVDKNNNPIMVSSYGKNLDLFSFLSQAGIDTYTDISTLQFGGFDDIPTLIMPITSVLINNTISNSTNMGSTVTVLFNQGWFSLTSSCSEDTSCILTYALETDIKNDAIRKIELIIDASLKALIDDWNTLSFKTVTQPRNSIQSSLKTSKPKPYKPKTTVIVKIQSQPVVPAPCAAGGFGGRFTFG